MKNLRKYIDSISPLAETEWTTIVDLALTVHLKKGELLVQEGERYNREVFIESGIMRGFIIDEEGNEKSTAFFQEGEFMSTNTFRTQNGISAYSYQALCEITLLLFDADRLKKVLSETKKLSGIGKAIKEKELSRLSNRDICLMQVKASDKYLKFTRFYPRIESLVSQRYIASYLGITPVSLSRIKKMLMLKTVNN